MNTLKRTITVLVVLNLMTSAVTPAQDVAAEVPQNTPAVEAKEKEIVEREIEIAAREAQRQADMAQRQAEMAQEQADAAVRRIAFEMERMESVPGAAPPAVQASRYPTISRSNWPYLSSRGSVLVIPSSEIQVADLLTINEYLNVMSRIFENNLQAVRIAPAGGGLFLPSGHDPLSALLGRGSGAIQSIYLQGYGALFLMRVDFPLSAPPQMPQKEETNGKGETDEVWEQWRQKMYEPERFAKSKAGEKAPEYDPEKVENLKTTLIKSLKHAANIRNLKPDESVVLTVTGSGLAGGTMMTTRRSVVVNGHNRVIEEPASDVGGSPMVLVIRAKKADIDGFAKGDLDLEQFRQRVQMISYPYLEGGSLRSGALQGH